LPPFIGLEGFEDHLRHRAKYIKKKANGAQSSFWILQNAVNTGKARVAGPVIIAILPCAIVISGNLSDAGIARAYPIRSEYGRP
jgi:hypothetical protein